jgi:hypothetical protein
LIAGRRVRLFSGFPDIFGGYPDFGFGGEAATEYFAQPIDPTRERQNDPIKLPLPSFVVCVAG